MTGISASTVQTFDLPALKSAPKTWVVWLSRAISLALFLAILFQFSQIDAAELAKAIPKNLWFVPVLLALYFALPVADWVIFRRLWSLPAAGFPILLAKRIGNEMLISYSGEVYFYLWARNRTGLSSAPFGAIKDVNILSSLAANLVALILLIVTFPFLTQLHIGDHIQAAVVSAAVVLTLSFLVLFFSRRVFTLERDQLWWVFAIHMFRLLAGALLCAALWYIILPGPHFGFWLALSMIRLLVGRLPFLPNKEALFAVIAVFLVGNDGAVSTLITLTATAIVALHIFVAAILGVMTLFWRDHDAFKLGART